MSFQEVSPERTFTSFSLRRFFSSCNLRNQGSPRVSVGNRSTSSFDVDTDSIHVTGCSKTQKIDRSFSVEVRTTVSFSFTLVKVGFDVFSSAWLLISGDSEVLVVIYTGLSNTEK